MSRPSVGDPMPDIAMETPDGGSIRPSDFRGNPAVIWFYPKDNTPGCTVEAKDFTSLSDDFAKAGVALLGVSKDSPEKHRKFIEKQALAVPLATDAAEGGLSDALGIWTEKQLYGKKFMGMVRTTYLLDAQGRIARLWDKVKVKGHAEEVLAASKSL
ncbi:Putative peroxiredoxin bcp [Tsuneonella dongtanensis]|uniref:thioredoxin-dependent peroxiredoxin n=1 Tax=Tsuneonella dongtanensis TaxID=692370 RepID=A0A1B2AA12_9SPHN|nr:peroxiredoxin [Tsuneonella dongtanensis]ANY18895.1 Putative peroxiredoxin bcp [Tsuneonella dongtanensis]